MSIDTTSEQLLTLSDAAQVFPGRPVALQTLHRWRLNGVRGAKLETCLIGGIRYTSHEAIQRFIVAQNAADTAADNVTISPKQRQRQSSAARQELAEMGIGGKR